MRLVVDDPVRAKESLTSKGFVNRVSDVIGAEPVSYTHLEVRLQINMQKDIRARDITEAVSVWMLTKNWQENAQKNCLAVSM